MVVKIQNQKVVEALGGCGAFMYGDFELASGKHSNYYIDIKKAVTDPKTLNLISKQMADLIKTMNVNKVAGVELGGIPLASVVSVKTELPLLIVRKADKEYGTRSRFVGTIEPEDKIVFIEDVTTSGGSVATAIEIVRQQGATVKHAISVVDREEGAKERLKSIGVELIPLVTTSDLVGE
jgi:orotate phosphoribosyltransferase